MTTSESQVTIYMGSTFATRIESPGLLSIAAYVHFAPAPPVVLADVEEEPLTSWRRTHAYVKQLLGGQQLSR